MAETETGAQTQARATALAETIARLEAVGAHADATLSPRAQAAHTALAMPDRSSALPQGGIVLPRVAVGDGPDAELTITGTLGQGGMGRVDLAVQRVFDRTVAVKRVRPDRYCAPAVQALLSEGRIVGRLEHPNIVPAHSLGRSAEGDPLLVMKRVEGVSWETLIREPQHEAWRAQGKDRLARHLEVLVAVCNAVEFAHRRGVVHCDLKPANVMVGDLGEVFVLDWGVALALDGERTADIAGTPAYMAPEMLGGTVSVTPRTDVYLLGAILHEVLTGRPPHAGATLPEVVMSIAESAPVDFGASVSSELAAICNRAMACDPAARFPSALALRDALSEHVLHRSSMDLVLEGTGLLRELERALAARGESEAGTLGVRRLATETDFAFRQALRIWPANPEAAAGRRDALSRFLAFELAERNGPAAKALLDELSDPEPVLADRVRGLLEYLADEARAKAELTRSLRDADFGVAARARIVVVGAMYSVLLLSSLALEAFGVTLTTERFFIVASAVALLYLALIARARRTLWANAANRRQQTAIAVLAATSWGTTALCWATEQPVEVAFGAFLLVGIAAGGQIAAWSERSNAVYLPGMGMALAAVWLWPGHGFGWLAVLSACALIAAAVRLRVKRPDPGGATSD